MILLLDNYDSFSYNLRDYALQAGLDCRYYRNDELTLSQIEEINPQGIIISPGPMRPEDHPLVMQVIDVFHRRTPIFGICLGFQAMGMYFGMDLRTAPEPVHGKASYISHAGEAMFAGLPSPLEVGRYHSLCLDSWEENEFEIISQSADGVPMAGVHTRWPLWGVQFHPESILTQGGHQMMRNWAQILSGS